MFSELHSSKFPQKKFCFLVSPQKQNSTRKSAIPSGTWSPLSSTPEPGHARKKTQNTKYANKYNLAKLLITTDLERPATSCRLHKITPPEILQKAITPYQTPGSGAVSRPRTEASASREYGTTSATQDGGRNNYGDTTSEGSIKTTQTLDRCNKPRGATKQSCESAEIDLKQGKGLIL